MSKQLNQRDLFSLILSLGFVVSQTDLAKLITDCSDDPYACDSDNLKKDISKILNGTRNGRTARTLYKHKGIRQFSTELFEKVFKDCDIDNGASQSYANEKFNLIKNYLFENDLIFNGQEENESYCKEFIIRLIIEGMTKTKLLSSNKENKESKESKNNNDQIFHDSYKYTPQILLRNQNIYCPNKCYGRNDVLSELTEKLLANHVAILSGMGGIGKTYITYQHAQKYERKQKVVFDNYSPSIKNTILSIQFENLNEIEMDEKGRYDKRIALLNSYNEDTLLIIDNVDSLPDDIDLLNDLFDSVKMHIIITTRLTDAFPLEQTILIKPLPFEDQLNVFQSNYNHMIPDSDLPILKDIFKSVEGNTYLIELIAKSMHATSYNASQMLNSLSNKDIDHLEPIYVTKDTKSAERNRFPIIIEKLFDLDYLDNNLKNGLLYLSLLPIEGVHRSFLYRLMPTFKNTFNILVSYSWAMEDSQEDIIRLHPIICDTVRRKLQPSLEKCNPFFSDIYTQIRNTETTLSASDRADYCKILKSIYEIDNFVLRTDNVKLLCDFAEFCYKSYEYNVSLRIYLVAKSISEQLSVNIQNSISIKIGDVYKRLAQLDKSIETYNNALSYISDQKEKIENIEQVADIHQKLSDVYRKHGNIEKAFEESSLSISNYELLLEKSNKKKASVSLKIAETLNSRGVICLNQGTSKNTPSKEKHHYFEEAYKYYMKARDMREQNNATKNNLAYSYHNLGSACYHLGRITEAIDYHKKALSIRKSIINISETEIASSYVWLGKDHLAEGEDFYNTAKSFFEKSLEIRIRILGDNHPEVAWSLHSLSEYYEAINDYKSALNYEKRVLVIREAALPPSHDYIIQTKDRISELTSKLV